MSEKYIRLVLMWRSVPETVRLRVMRRRKKSYPTAWRSPIRATAWRSPIRATAWRSPTNGVESRKEDSILRSQLDLGKSIFFVEESLNVAPPPVVVFRGLLLI